MPIFLGGKHLVVMKIVLKLMHIGQTTLTNLDQLMLITVSLITLNLET